MTTATLLTGMAVHNINPLVGNKARQGNIIMHGKTITEACEELVRQAEACQNDECKDSGHVAPENWEKVSAFICQKCGQPVTQG